MEDQLGVGLVGLLVLLKHGQITTISTLLTRYPFWESALDASSGLYDVGALETLFFHGLAAPFIGAGEGEGAISCTDKVQLGCRTVAYHAMAINDFKLCKWLLQIGMDPDEFYVEHDLDFSITKTPRLHCSFPGGIGTLKLYDGHMIPSLLAVAAENSDVDWMKFLVTEGVYVVDSMALLRAIKLRATIATIHFLLDAAKPRISSAERNYGVAALRQAISYRDILRIEVLCGVVHINGIEPSEEEFESSVGISPLGEAIIANDSGMVQLLLEHCASPNAFVSFEGLKMSEHIKSHMRRVTPLLAAIDVQSLPLVKILVQHGAELQYTRNMGISRTPLQRAAETGRFDIVDYLVGQGAIIDTTPVYSGGTALQLAAMSGFCGIAAFLLEQGADPMYPPAKGHGRTAFEAAAEWGHVDTMSLLMQWNVNLDAQFGEPPESQYERAFYFAENNGFMAASRFVEHLYEQRTRDESWPAGLVLDSM
ncbi:uncharacterized protein J4E84_005271 [Alternaria hordeiaustralica]|uniref:uncharacterized protein n=1 Tax=Alternaria hordeiaustralica TaxID=1187925 RepID=UPI0020C2E5A3|nr:uncharacterized protein J4E84_005271 [Alternaria hordeiaustralica]KAI4686900.1 hypothetical protein J4E84_005271 [Alternaria hordeiaustralica]